MPSTFHRGLTNNNAATAKNAKPDAGIMGGPSPNMSVKFNNPAAADSIKEKLQKQIKELEEKKGQIAAREAASSAPEKAAAETAPPVAV